jgi:hypothetical protein
MRKLNCDEARKLSIVDYLALCGFCPQYIKRVTIGISLRFCNDTLQLNCT